MKYCPECSSEIAILPIDGEERLVCVNACGFVYWNNPIPVAAGLIEINNQFLLARNREWPDGFFSLISGFIEAGESPETSIKRETEEELGLHTISSQFIGHYPFAPKNQLMIAYAVKTEGEIKLNDELAEYKLLSKEELVLYDFGVLKLGRIVVDKWLSINA